jgi:hypothetical protein
LPGQAGGIVTLIFDLVTLSYRAPACPAKLTRPRALRMSVMCYYSKMKLNVCNIIVVLLLPTILFAQDIDIQLLKQVNVAIIKKNKAFLEDITNAQHPGRTLKILPGQAGGIVTLIFDFVSLSQLAPACPCQINPAQGAALSVELNRLWR